MCLLQLNELREKEEILKESYSIGSLIWLAKSNILDSAKPR